MTNDELLQIIQKNAKDGVKKLDLSRQGLTSLPSEIGQLTHLHQLDLSRNQLTSLPAEIEKLKDLRRLILWQNQLTSLPSEIGSLGNLRELNLSNCFLTSLSTEIGKLVNLTLLSLSFNRLTSIPVEIGKLISLKELNLSYTRLTKLPTEIGQLTNLNQLKLGDSQLLSLPAAIGELTSLQELVLNDNCLAALPVEIGQLINLKELVLSGNQLVALPAEIGKLTNLKKLLLRDNPLTSLPPEIQRNSGLEILNFYRQQLEQSIDHLYEAKLLIVGEGGAGKTTLAKKIQNPDYQLKPDEVSTDGIEIIQYRFPLENGKEFRINIWDFGGQEIYHATHQFFLTKRSFYVLVADTRKEDTDFYYWLNVVELLSENSPLLIIKNEKQERKREINERQLRGEFTNLKETLATNFSTNRGLPEILAFIQHYIQNLPHVGTELPKTWVKVREALEQEKRSHVSLVDYLKLCQDNGFTRQEDALQLSGYLHDLGVCLHFQQDDLLMRIVILKPTWGTDAVYKVLDNAQVQKLGKFTREDLKAIWQGDEYANMRPELLRLMMNFKLCYEIPSCQGVYIAPQLLSPNQPEYSWDESDNLFLRYEYEFMPKGILTRLIVEINPWIEHQTCVWKTGVVLSKEKARAEIIELYRYHKGEIRIRVAGDRKRDLLTTVRYELDKIHRSYERLRYNTLVPCNCGTCKDSQTPHFYQLQVLHRFLENKQNQIQCQGSFQMVNVRGLVDDVIPTASRSPAPTQRSQQQQANLQQEWEVRNEKLGRLRQDLAIATETTRKFELEQQIQTEEAVLARLTAELDDIEQQLSE